MWLGIVQLATPRRPRHLTSRRPTPRRIPSHLDMPAPCFTPVTTAVASGSGNLKRDVKVAKKLSSPAQKVTLKDGDSVAIEGTVVGSPEYGESGQLFVNIDVQGTIYRVPADIVRPAAWRE